MSIFDPSELRREGMRVSARTVAALPRVNRSQDVIVLHPVIRLFLVTPSGQLYPRSYPISLYISISERSLPEGATH